ncbi:Uncharacterised protein [Vibrio cholerae]|nr:Uncharacterised protein [Vibrio cholerae]CSC85162.1 Uncharacterised protein [Vibrio cholerae]CSD03092.1 Uncharacterised protein [Vibrio cholerae]CSD13212.1 Uncharacterised protein [Vibrio cholerae]CSI13590.1 Uncharacterised protein [Vibrio cholerae]
MPQIAHTLSFFDGAVVQHFCPLFLSLHGVEDN